MTIGLPDSIKPDDQIEVQWERDEISTRVTVTLGDATIVVESADDDSVNNIPWLIAALPQILETAWSAIEAEQSLEEGEEE